MNGAASRSFQDCIYFERFELHFFPPGGRWLARLGALLHARVISRFNGLASVPGVGINFNRSYLDRANIEKFMRTGLCLSLSLSRSLSRAETGSKILSSRAPTRINSGRRSDERRGTRKGDEKSWRFDSKEQIDNFRFQSRKRSDSTNVKFVHSFVSTFFLLEVSTTRIFDVCQICNKFQILNLSRLEKTLSLYLHPTPPWREFARIGIDSLVVSIGGFQFKSMPSSKNQSSSSSDRYIGAKFMNRAPINQYYRVAVVKIADSFLLKGSRA